MSTTTSLRALARGEQAYRKHLKARRDQRDRGEVDSDPSKNKGWTFSKLEYLSRTQIISDNQEAGSGDMSEARWVGRDQDRRQQEARRREILGNQCPNVIRTMSRFFILMHFYIAFMSVCLNSKPQNE